LSVRAPSPDRVQPERCARVGAAIPAAAPGPKTRDPGGRPRCIHDLRPPGRFSAASSSRTRRSASARARASAAAPASVAAPAAAARAPRAAARAGAAALAPPPPRLGLPRGLGLRPPLYLGRQAPDPRAGLPVVAAPPLVTAPGVPLLPQPYPQRLQGDPPLLV